MWETIQERERSDAQPRDFQAIAVLGSSLSYRNHGPTASGPRFKFELSKPRTNRGPVQNVDFGGKTVHFIWVSGDRRAL